MATTTFANELEKMLKGTRTIKDLRIIGDTAYGRLNDMYNIRIEFVTRVHRVVYDAVAVTVIKQGAGVIDRCVIGFETVWNKQKSGFEESVPVLWLDTNSRKLPLTWLMACEEYEPTEQQWHCLYDKIKSYLELWK